MALTSLAKAEAATTDDTPAIDLGVRTEQVEVAVVGGLSVALAGRDETAELFVRIAMRKRANSSDPVVLATSMNGHKLAEVTSRPKVRALFESFQLISMDGQPAVLLSRLWPRAFKERVATTDLVHDVIRAGLRDRVRHFFLGGDARSNQEAIAVLRRLYPDIVVAGSHHGFFEDGRLAPVAYEIDSTEPDIVWVCMGVPREQRIAIELVGLLRRPAIIKTGGGLLDFLSGERKRAPGWMQAAGLEWFYRVCQEPTRLAWRYFSTNAVALVTLLMLKPAYKKLSL